MIAKLFTQPMAISTSDAFWLLLPLLIAVAIVYKTVRIPTLRGLPLKIVILVAEMLGGLAALGAALYLIQAYWP